MTTGALEPRVTELGGRLISVLEQEDDAAVILSALAYMVAVVCGSTAGGNADDYAKLANGFVETFRSIRHIADTVH
jgi:hypothetical protein